MGRLSQAVWACFLLLPPGLCAADLCAATDILGAYGLELEGTTKIGGPEKPIASIGRLEFDGKKEVAGVSSVNFNGLFLGNPVTGNYEFKTDCTLEIHLQDTSGAFQTLTGRASPGGNRVELRQTDSGTAIRGLLARTAGACGVSAFHGRFNFVLSAHITPFATDGAKGSGPATATIDADGAGNLVIYRGNAKTTGTYKVDSDCIVEAEFGLAGGDSAATIKLRGVLVNAGKEVLAVETDPEQVAAVRISQ